MKILLTGSSGFIGRNITKAFPEEIVCLLRNDSAFDSKTNETVPFVRYGPGMFKGISSIIHLGGLAHSNQFTSFDYQNANVKNTLDLALKAQEAGVKRFVFVSSIGVNGSSTVDLPFSITDKLKPHNEYAKSKYDAEIGLKKMSVDTGFEVVIVRPTLVYGPEAPGNFGMLTKLVKKMAILPFGLAKNRRDFIAVQNLADLLLTCATHSNAAGHIFLASDSETVSIKQFTNAIAKGLDKKLIHLPIPISLMHFAARLVGKSAMVEQLLGNLQIDSSNANEVLGWVPPYTMEQAMASLSENKK